MPSTTPTTTLLGLIHSILILLIILQTVFSRPTTSDNQITRPNYPMIVRGTDNKPGFDMIHSALSRSSLARDKRQLLSTAIRMAPAISSFATDLIKPLIQTIAARNRNQNYNKQLLAQAIPRIVSHSNIGNINHVQSLKKSITADRYDNLMDILQKNAKPISFQKHIPTYSNYQSLTTLINDTINGVDKVITHRLMEVFRTEHAFSSTVAQNLRILLHSQHNATHQFVQKVHDDLKNSLSLIENLDNYILYTILTAGILLSLCTVTAFGLTRNCVKKDFKIQHRKNEQKANSWAMKTFKQSQPLLPSAPSAPQSYNLVLQNPGADRPAILARRQN